VILDTDVIIDYLKRKPEASAKEIFRAVKAGEITAYMTSITLFELSRGARLSPQPEKSMNSVKTLQASIEVLPFNEEAAETAAAICVQLEERGEPLEIRDLFIAAIAKTMGLALTTRNTRHFDRIPGIKAITPQNLLKNISAHGHSRQDSKMS